MEKVTPELIDELLKKASDAERRYILELETGSRPGGMWVDVTRFEVVYGEADTLELEYSCSYPHYSGSRWLILPKTVPVVVRYWHRDDYEGDYREWEEIYVFTRDGWKMVRVK